jgi:myo-inositol-1(or 4)-monophosphatase
MTVRAKETVDRHASDIDRREIACREMILKAGAIARTGFLTAGSDPTPMKGPQDFLTATDKAVEEFLRSEVARRFPEDGFLGEESGGGAAQSLWVVDPIDGTANFSRGIPHYCISIAYLRANVVEVGAIYNPGLDELYLARRGRGATRNGSPIFVAATTDYARASVELGWSLRLPNERYVTALDRILTRGANVRRSGSGALGLAFVADGRLDAYAELHMNSWDCLAGLLLVEEAGGVVAPFLALNGLLEGGGVLAACPGVAAGISEATGIPI